MSDLYKKLEEATETISSTREVVEALSKRNKQLESYLERYKIVIDTIYKVHTEGGIVEQLLDDQVFHEVIKLAREIEK